MKLTPSISLAALLTFGASGLCGQTNTAASTTWTHGFEAAEGYRVGQSAVGAHVSLTGGTATILDQGAAEGAQFLRFIPQKTDDALVLRLPAGLAADDGRLVAFAVRLPDGAQTTRLVLSQRWTVALRPAAGGIEIETNETPPRRVNLPLEPGDWLPLGLREHGAADTWDLLIAGQVVLAGLPRQQATQAMSDLLIFADGSLDLDAVALTTQTDAANESDSSDESGIATDKTSPPAALTDRERSDWIGLALAAAREGDYTFAVATAEKLARRGGDASGQEMETARLLAMMAYALRGSGLHEQAAALGRLALQPLGQARGKAAQKSGPAHLRASSEFMAAQINEQLLGDAVEAERHFKKTLEFFPEHEGARGGEQRLARQREAVAKEKAFAQKNAATTSGQGGAQ